MKLRPLPIKGKVFRFLDLPAELRNNIYEIICNRTPIKLIRRPHKVARRQKTRQRHSYLQLAHINRKIRQEFLPIYYYSIIPHFSFNDAAEFVRDFLLPRTIKSSTRIITLDLIKDGKSPVNLYPLLKFIKADPGITLNVRHAHNQQQQHLRTLHMTAMTPVSLVSYAGSLRALLDHLTAPPKILAEKRWAQYFDRYVKELWITPSAKPHVCVVVKTAATEWWMGCDQVSKQELVAWAAKSGFPWHHSPWFSSVRPKLWTVEVRES